jgi:hypothetical protein
MVHCITPETFTTSSNQLHSFARMWAWGTSQKIVLMSYMHATEAHEVSIVRLLDDVLACMM